MINWSLGLRESLSMTLLRGLTVDVGVPSVVLLVLIIIPSSTIELSWSPAGAGGWSRTNIEFDRFRQAFKYDL